MTGRANGARPTLDSVAAHVGVSRQTVSNVINNPEIVRADTIAKVRAAIDELGYRPSAAARQLKTRRSHTFGMRLEPVREGINGLVLDQFLHHLVESAQRIDYRVQLFTAPDDAAEMDAIADLLVTSDLDGFVLTGTHHGDPRTAWLALRDVPFVTFGRPWGTVARHSWVDVDGAAGTRAAVAHLVERGHRRIGFVGWPHGSGTGEDRRAGWRAGMADAGLPVIPDWDAAVDNRVTEGRAAAARLAALPDAPTALVCASDSLAIGAAESGCAVVGFDDTPVAAALGLTTVTQPLADAAAECLRLLVDRVEGRAPTAPDHLLLDPHLTVRSSTPSITQEETP
jgi:DNA-binding LacI/PurR family transcriptional regulator